MSRPQNTFKSTQKHDQKPQKSSPALGGLDPFTQKLLIVLAIVVPVLAYLILKPSQQVQANAIEQTKQFAEFIQSQPQLAQAPEPSRQVASAPQAAATNNSGASAPVVLNAEVTPFDPNTALTVDDRIAINEMAMQWNQVDFVRDHNWRDQVESMFSIAERTQSPDVYDLLRRQIILGKVDDDAGNKIRSETWFERYMKFETRPVPRKELEDLFLHSQ